MRNLAGKDFHFAAGQIGIRFVALGHAPAHRDHVFGTQLFGASVRRLGKLLIEDDLGDAAAVAHVDEDQVAKIAPPMHPAHQHDFLFGVASAQIARVARALPVSQQIKRRHNRVPIFIRAYRISLSFRAKRGISHSPAP